jgi:glycosyltransferase involved in cell wall biosynthesis
MQGALVSILVPNYNYGHYLRQCLESILTQTYDNIEVIFSDNASTDDSFDIAYEYMKEYKDKLVLIRNRHNFGPYVNDRHATYLAKGRFHIHFGSDDVMMPNFVSRCMEIAQRYPNVGHVVAHANAIDESGKILEKAPFYNCSFVAPGTAQAAVLMMAGVTSHTSQTMYNRASEFYSLLQSPITSTTQGERSTNFVCSCHFDMAYIHEPMLLCRESKKSDGHRLDKTLLQVLGQFCLLHSFDEVGAQLKLDDVRRRLPQAVEKLGNLCLRYASIMLLDGEDEVARKYLYLAPAFKSGIENDEIYETLKDSLSLCREERQSAIRRIEALASSGFSQRTVSYDPPEGYLPL